MERLIDLFCHAIRISDPLSIKIAAKLGEFWARQREATMFGTPGENAVSVPDHGKESDSRRSRSTRKKQPVRKIVP